MSPTKPREHYVYIGCSEPFGEIHKTQDSFILPDDGRFYWIFHRLEYPRQRKAKVVFALFQFFGSRSIRLDPLQELRKYDRVYCIDTNHTQRAVTTAKQSDWLPERSDFVVTHLFTQPFTPSTPTPEREAWRRFIEAHDEGPQLKSCLVVDSALDALIAINRKEAPLIGDFFIPANWQLNYATSDVTDQFVMVRMMRMCDDANRRYAARGYRS